MFLSSLAQISTSCYKGMSHHLIYVVFVTITCISQCMEVYFILPAYEKLTHLTSKVLLTLNFNKAQNYSALHKWLPPPPHVASCTPACNNSDLKIDGIFSPQTSRSHVTGACRKFCRLRFTFLREEVLPEVSLTTNHNTFEPPPF